MTQSRKRKANRPRCPECNGDLSEWDSTILSDNPTGPLKTLCVWCDEDVTDYMGEGTNHE